MDREAPTIERHPHAEAVPTALGRPEIDSYLGQAEVLDVMRYYDMLYGAQQQHSEVTETQIKLAEVRLRQRMGNTVQTLHDAVKDALPPHRLDDYVISFGAKHPLAIWKELTALRQPGAVSKDGTMANTINDLYTGMIDVNRRDVSPRDLLRGLVGHFQIPEYRDHQAESVTAVDQPGRNIWKAIIYFPEQSGSDEQMKIATLQTEATTKPASAEPMVLATGQETTTVTTTPHNELVPQFTGEVDMKILSRLPSTLRFAWWMIHLDPESSSDWIKGLGMHQAKIAADYQKNGHESEAVQIMRSMVAAAKALHEQELIPR